MATTNNITGDSITSRPASNLYRDNYDNIFRKPKKETNQEEKGNGREEHDERSTEPVDARS